MKYVPTYQDYLNFASNQYDPESGRFLGLSEDAWNHLSEADRWGQVGGSVLVNSQDPRYADPKPLVGGEDGRNIYLRQGALGEDDVTHQADIGDGIFAHSEDQQTPGFQARAHDAPIWPLFALPLAFTGLGMLGGEGLFGGAASGADITLPSMLDPIATPAVGSLDLGGLDAAMSGLGLDTGGSILDTLGLEPMDPIVDPQVGMMQDPLLDWSPYMSSGPAGTPWYERFFNNLSRMPGSLNAFKPSGSSGGSSAGGGKLPGATAGPQLSHGNPKADKNEYALAPVKKAGPLSSYVGK